MTLRALFTLIAQLYRSRARPSPDHRESNDKGTAWCDYVTIVTDGFALRRHLEIAGLILRLKGEQE
jgi:hypothetical protein